MAVTRWTISQIGARQHYGVPRGFFYKNRLRHMFTELYCHRAHDVFRKFGMRGRRFASRYHRHLPNELVTAWNTRTLLDVTMNPVPKSRTERFYDFLRFGLKFDDWVTTAVRKKEFTPDDGFFSFNTGCLETIKYLRGMGVTCIVDQIDPARTEERIVNEEVQRWTGWQEKPGPIPEEYFQRLSAEWDAADLVLVNSHWSRKALIEQGVPDEKMFVVPVAYEPEEFYVKPLAKSEGPLRVLWLGSVNLRKGFPYLYEAAKLLAGERIEYVIAGEVDINKEIIDAAPPGMRFVGRVTRDQTRDTYRNADVFVLPTVSDGFAITQVEAMGFGLPVITTPNCGEVVTDGKDGLIVPARDSKALADALLKVARDRNLLYQMSRGALEKVAEFRLPRQAEVIDENVSRYLARR